MLDIRLIRENPELVKENIRKKFQDGKLELVDKVLELDQRNRAIKTEVEQLRAKRNAASKQIGALMGQKKHEEAEAVKKEVAQQPFNLRIFLSISLLTVCENVILSSFNLPSETHTGNFRLCGNAVSAPQGISFISQYIVYIFGGGFVNV